MDTDVYSTLRRAAGRAIQAPSVHNTQPWQIEIDGHTMTLRPIASRRLSVLDPTGRQLLISFGCAVCNARVSLAHDNWGVRSEIELGEDIADIRVRLTPDRSIATDEDLAALDAAVGLRQTNRRQFTGTEVPIGILGTLEAAAMAEGARLQIVQERDTLAVAELSQRADDVENLNPAYRAELRYWTSDDPARADGVPARAVPHVTGQSGDEIPIRDFDTQGRGWLPAETTSTRRQCLALLCTDGDEAPDWLRAGQALERVLLEITRSGFVASPLTQVTELPAAREQLRARLGLLSYPHVLLRIGLAPVTAGTPRRAYADVVTERA